MNKQKEIQKLIDNNYIKSILFSSISYSIMCVKKIIKVYNFYSWIIFIILIIFNYKTLEKMKNNNKYRRSIIIYSFIFSLLLVIGDVLYSIQINPIESLWNKVLSFECFLDFVGTYNLIYITLANIIPKLCECSKSKILKENMVKNPNLVYLFSFLIIFICWIPYFFAYYPGLLSYDSIQEIEIIMNNFTKISNHHPVFHVLFIYLPFFLGSKIFNSTNALVALSTLSQMIIMASIFAYLIKFLYLRKVKNWILFLIIIYFSIVPIHAFYSITMWKDVIFGGLTLLLTIQIFKLLEKDKLTFKNMIPFMIVSLLFLFFRNNAVYAYVFVIMFSFIVFKKYYKVLGITFLIILSTYFIVETKVFDYFNVEKTETAEYIGIPLQQIGRIVWKEKVELNEEESKLINDLIPINVLKQTYCPNTSDCIKLNKNYNAQAFEENKLAYFKMWLMLNVKHPLEASEAYLLSTIGYWYPNLEYWSIINNIYKNDFDISMQSKLPLVINITSSLASKNVPIVSMIFSIGLCFWIITLLSYITVKKTKFNRLLCFTPVFGIWITLMIASPVYGEYRYVYGMFTCLPLLFLLPYIELNKKNM